jgi:hypothetical protein
MNAKYGFVSNLLEFWNKHFVVVCVAQLVGAKDTIVGTGWNPQCAAFLILISPYVAIESAFE